MRSDLPINIKIVDGHYVLDLPLHDAPQKPSLAHRFLASLPMSKERQRKSALIKQLDHEMIQMSSDNENAQLLAHGSYSIDSPVPILSILRFYDVETIQFIVDAITSTRSTSRKAKLINAFTTNIDNKDDVLLYLNYKDVQEFSQKDHIPRGFEMTRYATFTEVQFLFSNADSQKLKYCRAGSREHQVVSALLDATTELEKLVRGSVVIGMNIDLASVIVDYPHDVSRVIEYITDRGIAPATVDIEHLREYLSNPEKALGSGFL